MIAMTCIIVRDTNMAPFNEKNPLQSLTIWGSVLSLGACLETLHEALQMVPAEALPPRAGTALTATVGILGAVLSIIGRVKATKKIRL
jgi:hypothetical protein